VDQQHGSLRHQSAIRCVEGKHPTAIRRCTNNPFIIGAVNDLDHTQSNKVAKTWSWTFTYCQGWARVEPRLHFYVLNLLKPSGNFTYHQV
jgi:hypothetical protein